MSDRLKIMLMDADPRGRLRWVSALHDFYEVVVPDPSEELVRAVRRARPAVLVLAMPRGRMGAAMRECRTIKTDGRDPPAVGLTDRWARLEDPTASLQSCLGDGYMGGNVEPQRMRTWVRDLADGVRPAIVEGEAELTLWTRFKRRS